ncbi:MAG: hypothetical protein HY812_04075 [Planctomycetes bacterium]|nr:hypothetical protein [Planctomycetota bacterium]
MAFRHVMTAALLALASCTSFPHEETSPLVKDQPSAIAGLPIPDSEPMRPALSTYFKVQDTASGVTIGYVVRCDPLPENAGVDRKYADGTMFIENNKFERIGFVTPLGRGYRHQGADAQEVGQGTVEELLPLFFGRPDLKLLPLDQ